MSFRTFLEREWPAIFHAALIREPSFKPLVARPVDLNFSHPRRSQQDRHTRPSDPCPPGTRHALMS